MAQETYLTVPEAARLLGVPEERLRRALREGVLTGSKRGGRQWVIPRSALEAWACAQGLTPREGPPA
jgi:excisionase family DNA binding protein